MVDHISSEKRSWLMSRVHSKNTTPEITVRKTLHAMGFRYRLHPSNIPGKPDVVLPRHKKIILVNGCFWHRHEGCKKATVPKTRIDFWIDKFEKNKKRDARTIGILENQGWKVLVIWQCQTKNTDELETRLREFLYE